MNSLSHIYPSFHPFNSLLSFKTNKQTKPTTTNTTQPPQRPKQGLPTSLFTHVFSYHAQIRGNAYGLECFSWCEDYSNRLNSFSNTAVSWHVLLSFLCFIRYLFPFSLCHTSSRNKGNSSNVYSIAIYSPKKWQVCNADLYKHFKVYSHEIFHVHIIYTRSGQLHQ